MKKILTLTFLLVLTLTASAQEPFLLVMGKQVTSTSTLPAGMSYDSAKRTLTLRSGEFTTKDNTPIIASNIPGLTITVSGRVTLNTTNSSPFVLNGNTTFVGGNRCRLTINSGANFPAIMCGDQTPNITFDNTMKIDALQYSEFIQGGGNIYFKSCYIQLEAESKHSHVYKAKGNVTFGPKIHFVDYAYAAYDAEAGILHDDLQNYIDQPTVIAPTYDVIIGRKYAYDGNAADILGDGTMMRAI